VVWRPVASRLAIGKMTDGLTAESRLWILLALTVLMGAATLAAWFSWRVVGLLILRRSARAAVLFGLSILYAIFPFDFLLDPIFADDLVLLAIGYWQWRKAKQVNLVGSAKAPEAGPIEAHYTVSE
jgi:hypothetical protein